jgi:hypothetical protein
MVVNGTYLLQAVYIQEALIHANHLSVMIIDRRSMFRDLLSIIVAPIVGRDREEFYGVHVRPQVVVVSYYAGSKLLNKT